MTKTLSASIIEKMMTPEEYSKFIEKYLSLRQTGRGHAPRPITDTDRAILKDYKAGSSMKQLATKYGISESRVSTSILKATRE